MQSYVAFEAILVAFLEAVKSNQIKLECGPMPIVIAALPNIGGAVCSTPQNLADAHY